MRLPYADLCALHDRLVERLYEKKIDLLTYIAEWDRLVTFTGWTWAEVALEVDRRWTTKNNRAQAFVC